jgi:lysophospholipase L1-like esterase
VGRRTKESNVLRLRQNIKLSKCATFCLCLILSYASPARPQEIATTGLPNPAGGSQAFRPEASTVPSPQAGEDRARQYASLNGRVKKQAASEQLKLAFLGDSITKGWSDRGSKIWNKNFAAMGAINLGIGGDETQHILWRIDHGSFEGYSPKVIVLLIGTNNLGNSHHDPRHTAQGIRAVVRRLVEKFPDAKILLLGVFPRGPAVGDPYRRQIIEVNENIKDLEDNNHVFYMDIGDKFKSHDGSISPEIMFDGLHLSTQGYEICARAIAPKIKELAESRATAN